MIFGHNCDVVATIMTGWPFTHHDLSPPSPHTSHIVDCILLHYNPSLRTSPPPFHQHSTLSGDTSRSPLLPPLIAPHRKPQQLTPPINYSLPHPHPHIPQSLHVNALCLFWPPLSSSPPPTPTPFPCPHPPHTHLVLPDGGLALHLNAHHSRPHVLGLVTQLVLRGGAGGTGGKEQGHGGVGWGG